MAAQSGGRRISTVKGDPGERFYGELRGAGKRPVIYLDGVEQTAVVTADEDLGMVRRHVSAGGKQLAYNDATGEFIFEDVFGHVRIGIVG